MLIACLWREADKWNSSEVIALENQWPAPKTLGQRWKGPSLPQLLISVHDLSLPSCCLTALAC